MLLLASIPAMSARPSPLKSPAGCGPTAMNRLQVSSVQTWSRFIAVGPQPAGDFNGDGRADIAGIDANNNMTLYTGDGAGHLVNYVAMWHGNGLWTGFSAVVAGDFN